MMELDLDFGVSRIPRAGYGHSTIEPNYRTQQSGTSNKRSLCGCAGVLQELTASNCSDDVLQEISARYKIQGD